MRRMKNNRLGLDAVAEWQLRGSSGDFEIAEAFLHFGIPEPLSSALGIRPFDGIISWEMRVFSIWQMLVQIEQRWHLSCPKKWWWKCRELFSWRTRTIRSSYRHRCWKSTLPILQQLTSFDVVKPDLSVGSFISMTEVLPNSHNFRGEHYRSLSIAMDI